MLVPGRGTAPFSPHCSDDTWPVGRLSSPLRRRQRPMPLRSALRQSDKPRNSSHALPGAEHCKMMTAKADRGIGVCGQTAVSKSTDPQSEGEEKMAYGAPCPAFLFPRPASPPRICRQGIPWMTFLDPPRPARCLAISTAMRGEAKYSSAMWDFRKPYDLGQFPRHLTVSSVTLTERLCGSYSRGFAELRLPVV